LAEAKEVEPFAIWLCAQVRRVGYSAEALITGSPRKRFEKAKRLGSPTVLIVDNYTTEGNQIANVRWKLMTGFPSIDEKMERLIFSAMIREYDVVGTLEMALNGQELAVYPNGTLG
jgi:hypothetical protein